MINQSRLFSDCFTYKHTLTHAQTHIHSHTHILTYSHSHLSQTCDPYGIDVSSFSSLQDGTTATLSSFEPDFDLEAITSFYAGRLYEYVWCYVMAQQGVGVPLWSVESVHLVLALCYLVNNRFKEQAISVNIGMWFV